MKLVYANLKMHFLKDEMQNYISSLTIYNKDNLVIFPSSLYLSMFKDKGYEVGSQDISFKERASLTGDLSVLQLKETGITYTLIGHSERRQYYNDSKYVHDKLNLALNNHLKIVLCIGETLEERKNNETITILRKEIDEAFLNINKESLSNVIIAYEPIWSIGSGIIPSTDEIKEITKEIKDYILNKYNVNIKVLYGGSVNLDNIDDLETISNLDGYLVGTASLDSLKFSELVNKIN